MMQSKAIAWVVLLLAMTALSAQDKIVVSLGSAEKDPNDPKVFVPIQLQGGENQIVRIVAEVQFANKGIQLTGVDASDGLRSADGQVSLEKATASEGDHSKARVTLSGKKALPNSTLAQLAFNVESEQDEPVKIELKASAYDAKGQEVTPVSSASGEISFAPAIFGCFFYMH